jgi:hypothetical protein
MEIKEYNIKQLEKFNSDTSASLVGTMKIEIKKKCGRD